MEYDPFSYLKSKKLESPKNTMRNGEDFEQLAQIGLPLKLELPENYHQFFSVLEK